jgi:hypothetical protein
MCVARIVVIAVGVILREIVLTHARHSLLQQAQSVYADGLFLAETANNKKATALQRTAA